MDPMTKGDMPIRLALNVKTLRLRELSGVAISRCDPGLDCLSCRDTLTPQLEFMCGAAQDKPDRREVA